MSFHTLNFPNPGLFLISIADCDDTSHTDENDPADAERHSGDFEPARRRNLRESHNSDSDSDEDDLRSIDDVPVETNYVVQHEEEFGCVIFTAPCSIWCLR